MLQLEPLLDRQPARALRRPAPARRHRPRHRARARRVPVRRAAVQSRCGAARQRPASRSPSCTSSLGATMVYVTHDQVEAMTLADQIVVMNQGRIEQIGKPLDLYYKPANLFVAGFIGSPAMNFFAATVSIGSRVGEARIAGPSIAPLTLPAGALDARRQAHGRRPAGASRQRRRVLDVGNRRTGRTARRVLLRPCPDRRRQADRRGNPRPRHADARTQRDLRRTAAGCACVRPGGAEDHAPVAPATLWPAMKSRSFDRVSSRAIAENLTEAPEFWRRSGGNPCETRRLSHNSRTFPDGETENRVRGGRPHGVHIGGE